MRPEITTEWCTKNFPAVDPLALPELRWKFRRTFEEEILLFRKFTARLLGAPRAYALAFPDAPMPACELRVISYVLPQTPKTRADQRLEDRVPAERWARSRFHGEEFNCDLRLYLAETLTRAGYPSVAAERLPGFGYQHSERFGLASNWSERHAAFVAGHGTFGLSDGMITRWGKAVRFGSVVSRGRLSHFPVCALISRCRQPAGRSFPRIPPTPVIIRANASLTA